MKEIRVEAKTIQDAVEKGLVEMGLRRDQVEVVVVNEGSKGILGFGAKKACVCLREKKWTDGASETEERRPEGRGRTHGRRGAGARRGNAPRREYSRPGYQRVDREGPGNATERHAPVAEPAAQSRPAERRGRQERPEPVYADVALPGASVAAAPEDPLEYAKTVLARILELMGVQAAVTEAAYDAKEGLVNISFESGDSDAFVRENAKGLESLQFLVNAVINRSRRVRTAVRIDTGGYWKSREAELSKQVEYAVKSVQETARPYRLEPMPAPLRKFVHSLVKISYPGMETFSEGEGRWRKVVIKPPSKKEEAAKQ